MSFSLYLLCQIDTPILRADVASFVADGSYFDTSPTYDPALQGDLGELIIRYAPGRSVRLTRLEGDDLQNAIDESSEALDSAPIPQDARERLRDQLTRTRSVIEVEVDRDTMSNEAWSMLDALQADILRSRRGLLYVYGEGIYGPDLRLWPIR